MLRRDFIALNEHIRKEEMSEINNVRSHLNNLEKEKQNKPRVSRRKEVIKREIFNKRYLKQRAGSLKSSILLSNLYQE